MMRMARQPAGRLKVWRAVLWPSWWWLVLLPYGLVQMLQTFRSELSETVQRRLMLAHILPGWPWYGWMIGWLLLLIGLILVGSFRVVRSLSPTMQQITLEHYAMNVSLLRMKLYKWGGDTKVLDEVVNDVVELKDSLAFYLKENLPEYRSDIITTSIAPFSPVDLGSGDANALVTYLDDLYTRLLSVKNRLRGDF